MAFQFLGTTGLFANFVGFIFYTLIFLYLFLYNIDDSIHYTTFLHLIEYLNNTLKSQFPNHFPNLNMCDMLYIKPL